MSINTEEIARELHGGYAGDELLPFVATAGYYTPMDELPQEVQDVYTYNPEKAKQLLADAGYSEGDVEFTNYFCHRGYGGYDEWHLLINSYFAAIGVKTEMKFLDCGAYMGMMFSEDHTLFDGMGHRGSGYQPAPTDAGFRIGAFYSGNDFPYHVNDPHYDALYERWRDEVDEGSAEWNALLKEMNDYAFTQTWFLPMPSPNLFALWQPWFKNYVPGWGVLFSFLDGSLAHQWIDQELKVKMGH
jgi:peptide/nickel transport system substrate-binding protein